VLTHLARGGATTAVIVDGRGLAIDASDTSLVAELERVNIENKAAVLHYRTPAGLAQLADRSATGSGVGWVDAAVERVLAAAGKPGAADVLELDVDDRTVLAARIEATGWFVVLIGHKG